MSQLRRLEQTTDFLYDPDKVLVVSATTKDKYNQTLLYESLRDQSYTGKYIIHENNKKGLCEIYNQYITDEWDCVIFAHDDVYIDSCNFVEKIYDGFRYDRFDVCGLAGGSNLKIQKPLLWHLMTTRETQSGVVSHGTKSKYLPSVFGHIGKKTVLLDGLFLALQPKTLIEKNVKFDENIKGFHHYDLKFSVDCFQAGLILGTVPIHVIHNSPGLGDFTKDFRDSEEYFYNELKRYARE
tara:strand:- start:12634 stop:13350 length:717 start_codon:yes stop_codon:yes gene_type:complete